MSGRYLIPALRGRSYLRTEEVILRSRFITTLGYAPTQEDARALVARVNAEFTGASHNCWAYVVGPPGSTAQIGMSDDGEPHGTAGRPMLTVLMHSGVGDVSAVVTRYFGGTLLGTGGLVKAYSGGVQAALAKLSTVEHVPLASLAVVVAYTAVTPVRRLLPEFEAVIAAEVYGSDVTYRISLPAERTGEFAAALLDITNGQALVEPA